MSTLCIIKDTKLLKNCIFNLKFEYKILTSVSIIGGGNVGYHFYNCIERLDSYAIKQVYNRSSSDDYFWLEEDKLIHNIENLKKADVYIVAISDSAIDKVAEKLTLDEHSVVVHTSGATHLSVLQNVSRNYGVLYPLQSLLKGEVCDFSNIPLLIESNNDCSKYMINKLANELSNSVEYCNSENRLKYHTMAVFTQNFSQFLNIEANQFLLSKGLHFEKLIPLLKKNIGRLESKDSLKKMTGPAARGDLLTIDKHLEELKQNNTIYEVYRFLSDKISENEASD